MTEDRSKEISKHLSKEEVIRVNWLAVVLVLALLALFAFHLSRTNATSGEDPKLMERNIDRILSFQIADAQSIEKEVDQLDEESLAGEDPESKRARYMKRFKNDVVVGDSLTEGLSVYGWLSSEQVFSEIGASVLGSGELFESAAATYPKTAYFAFGMNDMGNYGDNVEGFIERYTELIRNFEKKSPNTTVFICSISTPTEEAIEWNHSVGRYKTYNKALQKMSDDLGLKYIDASDILPEHPEFYAGDGIHASSDYYPLWMDRVLRESRTVSKKREVSGSSDNKESKIGKDSKDN